MKGFSAVIFALLLAVVGVCAQDEKSQVFYSLEGSSVASGRLVQASVVRRMVDRLVCAVTRKSTVPEAWRSLVSPGDKVGIKVAASGRAQSGTNPEVVDAIVEGLLSAGVPRSNIIVWDKNMDDLLASGFSKRDGRYQLEAIDPRTGYDAKAQVSAPVLGRLIWGDSKFGDRNSSRIVDMLTNGDQLSSSSYFAKVLSKGVTKVINVPSLTDNFLTGVNGAIVNMTISNIDNWRRFAKSAADGDSYIAELYADPIIHDKVVITILDALFLQYAGGPFPNPNFTLENCTLFASKDPVAIDATAVRLINEIRISNKMPSIRTMSAYVEAAQQLGLGQFAESKIQTLRVGVDGVR